MTHEWRERWKSQFCLAILLLLFLAVGARCVYLQFYRHDHFVERAQRQQLKIIPQSARRGHIVDRNGIVLAQSVQKFSVALDPGLVVDKARTARKLGTALTINADTLHQKILARTDKRFLWVKRFIDRQEQERLSGLDLPGLIIQKEYHREYPMGTLAAHVIGFTDIDGRGLEGIEGSMEEYLGCETGRWLLRSDVGRRPIGSHSQCQSGEDGKTVVLTLDMTIQACLEEQLQATVEKFNASGATGIVMDPRNFEVLALANYPTFDPGLARKTEPALRRNRALTDPVEPGSLFKPFTIASAVDGGYVTLNQKINCLEGPYRGKGIGVIREYKYYFGSISVADVIVRSSNIGTAKIARKMGKKYFYPMIEEFGFGQKTGIDLPGEGAGILMPLKEWKWGDYALTRASYGQGPIAATPIQLIRAFSILANGGRQGKPIAVKNVMSTDGPRRTEEAVPAGANDDESLPVSSVVSEKVARNVVQKALQGVVERKGGTAHNAYIEGYGVFGKTGTAQVPLKNGRGYEPNKYVSSFMAGAPAENPRICVLIMVKEPDRSLGLGYTGGAVAAKAVGLVINQTLAYLGVEKKKTDESLAYNQ
jgi:cell division protein FtsI (penicillin-binding protein 3)